ncbi:MAG: ClC family H(+)/Cl(-) exchange transporter [Treponema sp.]|jgi:H+/Cl- antiporter ClcA|nr:ClC family H(+)/Cl(-) exchange transporter [Treponema sp.]
MAGPLEKIALPIQLGYRSRLAVIIESIVIGFITGFIIVFFRVSLVKAEELRRRFYTFLVGAPFYWILLWALLLALAGLFLGWTAKKRPMVKGSGIPQVKGYLTRQMVLEWAPELPLKLVTGILGLGAGLSLGREGPSILIGAYVGLGVLTLFRRPYAERRSLVSAAAAAGMAAAFNAPLAGVLFSIEELQCGFSALNIACAMGASMAADTVAGFFFGLGPIFDFRYVDALALGSLPWVVLLGIFCGLLGALFKRSLYCSLNLYDRLRVPPLVRPVLPLLVSIPLGFFFYDITGGGHSLIEALSREQPALGMIALLFLGKLLFTAFCYGSGTSGGIFLPFLSCGALTGAALGVFLNMAGFIETARNVNFMILGMAGFFAAVVKAPVTGIILILEMSGNFNQLGSLVLVSLSAFVTTEVIVSRPVYAVLLERALAGKRPFPARKRPAAL